MLRRIAWPGGIRLALRSKELRATLELRDCLRNAGDDSVSRPLSSQGRRDVEASAESRMG